MTKLSKSNFKVQKVIDLKKTNNQLYVALVDIIGIEENYE